MIVMFFYGSELEAQRADTRAAANKSKNKTICIPSYQPLYVMHQLSLCLAFAEFACAKAPP